MDGRESMKHMVMIRDCQMAALFLWTLVCLELRSFSCSEK